MKNNEKHLIQKVEMVKRVIYSGIDGNCRFLLLGFPETIEHAIAFEKACTKINAIIYTSPKGVDKVEIKDNNLSSNTLDTYFSKINRLKTMQEWDMSTFEEHLGKRTTWGIITGHKYQGAELVRDELK